VSNGRAEWIWAMKKEFKNKVARLDAKPVSVLHGNKTVTFGVIFSTRQNLSAYPLDKSHQVHVISESGPQSRELNSLGWVC
jgi:hypothetical protein